MDEQFARNLAAAMASSCSPSGTERIKDPLKAMRKSKDTREFILAMLELKTVLDGLKDHTPQEKAALNTLDTLFVHLKTLMDTKSSDAAFSAAWTQVSLSILAKELPKELHSEVMLVYMRLMCVRKGDPNFVSEIEAAQTATNLFCQVMAACAAVASMPGGD